MTNQASGQSAVQERAEGDTAFRIRRFQQGDIRGLVALINTVDTAYNLDWGTSEETFTRDLQAPREEPERQIIVVEAPGLEGIAAMGRVGYEHDAEKHERIFYLDVTVHPDMVGRGIEQAIAQHLLEIVHGYQNDPAMERVGNVIVKSFMREELFHIRELIANMGLKEVRQYWTMARPLDQPIDEPPAIEGVNMRLYNKEKDIEGARTGFNASFADHFDHHETPPEDWEHYVGGPTIRPDISWLAEPVEEPGKIIGFCICAIFEEDNKRRGKSEGWIDILGTVRPWRRLGLGRSLLLQGLHSLRNAGMDTALLGVDSLSLTGANRLYESVGFRVRNRVLQYEAPLDKVSAG